MTSLILLILFLLLSLLFNVTLFHVNEFSKSLFFYHRYFSFPSKIMEENVSPLFPAPLLPARTFFDLSLSSSKFCKQGGQKTPSQRGRGQYETSYFKK